MSTTSTGLPIPVVDVAAARSAALRLRQAAVAADECLDELVDAAPAGWSGAASGAYLDGRAVVSRRATDLADACTLLDRAVVGFSEEAAAVLPPWRTAAERLEALEAVVADPAAGGPDVPALGRLESLVQERDALRSEVAAWERRFGEAEMALTASCSQALATVDDGRLSTGDQLWAIPETVVRQLVVEPVELAGVLLDDPSRADDVARAAWFGLVDQLRNPRRTAEELAGVPAYEDGRWGEGVGTGLATLGGLWGGRRLLLPDGPDGSRTGPGRRSSTADGMGEKDAIDDHEVRSRLTDEEAARFRRNVQDPSAPRPRLQTLDELRAGVDLSRSEHAALGHTLSRHVDVEPDYLAFRLQHGTPGNDGSIGYAPRQASAWADRSTAETTITDAINAPHNARAIQRLVDGRSSQARIWLYGEDLGVEASLNPQGVPVLDTARWASISLMSDGRGGFYVETAFVRTTPPNEAVQAGATGR